MESELKQKENAIQDWTDMIKKSWTWARLTEKEKDTFIELLSHPCSAVVIKGDYEQRWESCEALYHTYLEGLGYNPLNWRDDYQESEYYEVSYKKGKEEKQITFSKKDLAKVFANGLRYEGCSDVVVTKVVIKTSIVGVL